MASTSAPGQDDHALAKVFLGRSCASLPRVRGWSHARVSGFGDSPVSGRKPARTHVPPAADATTTRAAHSGPAPKRECILLPSVCARNQVHFRFGRMPMRCRKRDSTVTWPLGCLGTIRERFERSLRWELCERGACCGTSVTTANRVVHASRVLADFEEDPLGLRTSPSRASHVHLWLGAADVSGCDCGHRCLRLVDDSWCCCPNSRVLCERRGGSAQPGRSLDGIRDGDCLRHVDYGLRPSHG